MATTYKPKNILITGAAGFVGSHVCNRLIRTYPDYKITVLDKLDYCSNLKNLLPSHSSPNFKFMKGDITSADLVNDILLTESIDTILHFAAQTHVDNSFGNSFEFTKNNISGTHVLLEASRLSGQTKRFIYVSTDEVYGESEEDQMEGNHEASRMLPTNPYSATKAGAEMLVMAYGKSYGLPIIITRGNNVYGPKQFPEKLIPKFLLLAMEGKDLPIHGDGSNVRSYVYCEDVAEAFDVILHRGEAGQAYNIATKKEMRVIEVVRDICRLFSLDPNKHVKFVENRPFNDRRYFSDDRKLKNLGWFERTAWEEGLKRTMEWYVKNPNWWDDVSVALLPHPRMLDVPGHKRYIKGNHNSKNHASFYLSSQSRMVVPATRDKLYTQKAPLKFLIYGGSGWIGGFLGKICDNQGIHFEYGKGCLEDRSMILADIEAIQPTHVFNASGVNSAASLEWHEHETCKPETIRADFLGVLTLADVCKQHGLLLINYSFYSKLYAMVKELLEAYDNVCTLIMQFPVSSDLRNPQNFITIITRSGKVANILSSITVLDELVPISVEMAKRNFKGTWKLSNPGIITPNEILEMYKSYVGPNFKWVNFTPKEQVKFPSSQGISEMEASKLQKEFPELLNVKDSLLKYVFRSKSKL